MVSRLIDSVATAFIESPPSDLTEEVEISRSDNNNNSNSSHKQVVVNEFTTINGSTSSHTMEESHDGGDLVVSVITHSSQREDLVPPSSLFKTRTPKSQQQQKQQPLSIPSCSSPYDCYVTGVGLEQYFEDDDESDGDDSDSVTSSDVPFFFQGANTEFLESTWAAVVSESNQMHIPMLAIATTAVMVHPLIFVAGAGVAAASFWAVGAFSDVLKYEYFTDSSFSQLFWKEEETKPAIEEGKQVHEPTKAKGVELQQSFSSSNRTEATEETPLAAAPIPPPAVASKKRAASIDREASTRDWLNKHFIPLENEVVSRVEFSGLNASQFFEIFFGDDAPFTFKEFQKKRGDIDIVYGKWATPAKGGPTSFHQDAKPTRLEHGTTQQERTLDFKTLTKSYFGPAYATAQKTQRVTKRGKRLVVLESRTRLEGIPFCDRFQVLERWRMETCVNSKRSTLLTVSFEVQFIKTCSFEGQIRKKSSGTVTEIVTSWCDMAKEALERTAAKAHEDEEDHEEDEQPTRDENAVDLVERTSKELEERHEEKLRHLQEEIQKGGGLESIEVQHNVQEFASSPQRKTMEVVPDKKRSPPRRSRSLRGIGNSVRQRFSRKTSMPLNALE